VKTSTAPHPVGFCSSNVVKLLPRREVVCLEAVTVPCTKFPDGCFVFATERGGPFTPDAVNRLIKRIGERVGFAFPRFTATCYGTPAATPWRMRAMIRGRSTRSSLDPAHRPLYRAVADAVQGFLADITSAPLSKLVADCRGGPRRCPRRSRASVSRCHTMPVSLDAADLDPSF
jgi:hypothetical protein